MKIQHLNAIRHVLAAAAFGVPAAQADGLPPHGDVESVATFDRHNAIEPTVGVIVGSDGSYYGTSAGGGGKSGKGVIYKAGPHGEGVTVVHVFDDKKTLPYEPRSGLIQASDGMLYGTTYRGGAFDMGTVFRLHLDGSGFEVLHEFDSEDGGSPSAEVTEGSDEDLYGVTNNTVFRMSKDGSSFVVLADTGSLGLNGAGRLLEGQRGVFYSASPHSGGSAGAIFSVDADGQLVVLHYFDPAKEGSYPYANLAFNADRSALVGATESDGALGHGSVFEYSLSGTLHVLADFKEGANVNKTPLALGKDGKTFYGCMDVGLRKSKVFAVGPDGHVREIASFRGEAATYQPTLNKDGGLLIMETTGKYVHRGALLKVFDQ